MRTLVVGDVHGCSQELATLMATASADRVVLVGDLYTKGPDPAGVWHLIRETGAECVLGNHDQRLLDVLDGERPKDKHGHAVAEALDAADKAWREHLRSTPLWREDVAGFTVVHAGVHPDKGLHGSSRHELINIRRTTGGKDVEDDPGPFWYRAYEGRRKFVFGHDAARGLVRVEKNGRPSIIGLDTGCVYGGQLSGWLVEEDVLIQVPAGRVWQAVRK